MKNWKNNRVFFWLRIILLFCGLFANASVLNNYRHVSSDFVQDYVAAYSIRKGVSLYQEDFQKQAIKITGFSGPPHFHPPFNALLFFPFTFLNYKIAYVVLGIFSILLLLMINLLVSIGLCFDREWFLNIMCFTLFWYPVIYCLGTGQTSMIIAACLIGGWFCLRSEKVYLAGFCFALATLMKLFPGLILLYLLMKKNWRSFFATTFFLAIGLSITAFIVGFDDMMIFSNIRITKYVNEWSGHVLNHSVNGMIVRILSESNSWIEPLASLPRITPLLIILLNSLILIYTAIKIYKLSDRNDLADYAFGLTIVAMLLLSPFTWGHIFPVLILPIGLLLREYIQKPSTVKLCMILSALLLISLPDVFIARKLMAIHHPFGMPWYSMILTLGPAVGLLLLWGAFCQRASPNFS